MPPRKDPSNPAPRPLTRTCPRKQCSRGSRATNSTSTASRPLASSLLPGQSRSRARRSRHKSGTRVSLDSRQVPVRGSQREELITRIGSRTTSAGQERYRAITSACVGYTFLSACLREDEVLTTSATQVLPRSRRRPPRLRYCQARDLRQRPPLAQRAPRPCRLEDCHHARRKQERPEAPPRRPDRGGKTLLARERPELVSPPSREAQFRPSQLTGLHLCGE